MMKLRSGFLLIILMWAGAVALLAQADSIENDAQEYTRVVMQHDQLLLKFNMHQAGNDAQAEMSRLEAALAAIKARYARGRVPATVGSAFDKRVRALSSEVIAPARKDWVVDVFPEPAVVAAAYPDIEGAAAMQVLARTLEDKLGKPLTAAASAKIARYQEAWVRINPHSRTDYTARLDAIDKLRRSRFAIDVVRKLVPVYAVEVENKMGKVGYETAVVSDEQQFRQGAAIVAVLLLAIPVLYLIFGEWTRKKQGNRTAGDTGPFQLPAALDYVRVFRKGYPLSYTCGEIKGIKSFGFDSTSSGYNFGSDGTATRSPGAIRQLKLDYEIEQPDGSIATLHFKGYKASLPIATVGQLFSAVGSGKNVLLCYNHTKAAFRPFEVGIRKANQVRFVFIWLASILVSIVGFLTVERLYVLGTTLDKLVGSPNVRASIVTSIPFTAAYIAIIALTVRILRVWQFKRKWPVPMEKFMAEQTAPLERHFGSEKRDRARIDKLIEKHRSKS